MSELYHLIYLSRLAPDASASCVASIVRAARLRNQIAQVSGLLVFDGARFCQYLEGPSATVCGLAERISKDSRNTDFRVIHQAEFDGPPLLPQPGLEYALSYDEHLECFEESDGPTSVLLFRDLIPAFDMEPGRHAS